MLADFQYCLLVADAIRTNAVMSWHVLCSIRPRAWKAKSCKATELSNFVHSLGFNMLGLSDWPRALPSQGPLTLNGA